MITLIPSREPNAAQKAQIARKYGMFIHFGINTFNNTEWSDGTLPLDSCAPDAIDADSWVRHAYEAGMNYVILITKTPRRFLPFRHRHDGILRQQHQKSDRRCCRGRESL